MSEKMILTIILLMVFGSIVLVIRDLGKCRNPSILTMSLAVCALIFTMFGFELATYDIEIGKQYTKSAKDPFRPAVIYEVIDMDDNYVEYLYIGDNYVFTNSSTIREFYRDIEK